VIRYEEKGYGLHIKLAAAGFACGHYNNVFRTAHEKDEAAVQAIIDGYTLDECKAYIRGEIDELMRQKLDAMIAGRSPLEVAYFPTKAAEADALGKGGAAPTLEKEAVARGITVEQLAAKVLENTDMQAEIVGVAGKHKDVLGALTTFAEVLAYDYRVGWP